ncbi:MAG: calcium-binding protein, partial [Proteobacteria bacterium]
GDARKLAALEAFLGQGYLGTWCWGTRDPNPHGQASPILLTAYGQLADWVDSQILAQSLYKPLYDSIGLVWNADEQSLELDVAAVVSSLRMNYEADAAQGRTWMVNFAHNLNAQGDLGKQVVVKLEQLGSLEGEGFEFFLATLGYTPVFGTSSVDSLTSQAGLDNMFIAGAGNDTIHAGSMRNVFVFNAGDGWDTIHECHSGSKVGGVNRDSLQLGSGIASSTTQVMRGLGSDSDDVTLVFGGGDQVTLKSYLVSDYRLQSIVFADGTEWDYTKVASLLKYAGSDGDDSATGLIDQGNDMDGRAGNDAIMGGNFNDDLRGGVGNDTLNGGNGGDDTLTGGTGNDVLDGGIGSDTYVFDSGDGADRITDYDYFDGNLDTLRLGAGLLAANIEVFRVSDDLFLRWAGNRGAAIERIEVMGNDALNATGNGKGQQIVGNGAANELRGGGGADTILGQGGDDRLILGTAERASLG